jgi:hypothetical protein
MHLWKRTPPVFFAHERWIFVRSINQAAVFILGQLKPHEIDFSGEFGEDGRHSTEGHRGRS